MAAVIDTNVLLHGRGNLDHDKVFITDGVMEEVRSQRGKNVLRNFDYEVFNPSASAMEKVSEKADQLNSPTSETDEALVAAAMESGHILVTDDKAMQNLALHMDVDCEGFLDDMIDSKFRWEKVCSNCGNEVSSPPCPRCGSPQLRRKQVRCS